MRFPLFSWLLLLYSVSFLFSIDEFLVCSQCLEDQRSLLLHLNESLSFNPSRSVTSKLASWNTSIDCCQWKGITCAEDSGHVNGLDLSSEDISGGIDNSRSSLFNLRYLQSLNLAYNSFNSTPIPSGLVKLINLTNLNLSNAGFAGQVPIEISRLTRLVSLDLSIASPGQTLLRLKNPDLRTLVGNLRGLRTLSLDGVNISEKGSQWCRALSSALPNLQVLSLSNCYLSGPLDSSLSKLSLLSQIRLNQNNLSAEVPIYFEDFNNLTSLRLSSCGLSGKFPERILQRSTLQSLDVSLNPLLHGSLPEFPRNGSLQTLVLSTTSFSGSLPDSIGNLSLLSKLELKSCSFNGSIPSSVTELNQLDSLDLSLNSFTGPVPPLPETLTQVILAHNSFTGSLPPDSLWMRLVKLVNLDLRNNSLNGTIPMSLFTLPSLEKLQLGHNQFAGQLMELRNGSSAPLDTLDLSSNKLEGPIPLSIFELQHLSVLTLSYNNFSGNIELEMIQKLQNLTSLDLSYNSLLINTSGSNPNSSFPHITTLKLASCKLRGIPGFLRRNQPNLNNLDLSNNQIYGQIPTWVWKIGDGSVTYLNLSFNFLDNLELPLPDLSESSLAVLDLHSNLLGGPIPFLSSALIYLDFSNNSFQSIPNDLSPYLVYTIFFSLSSNNLTGEIPQSICSAGYLQVLDLSNNSFSGTIPSCLAGMSATLTVLNLRHNNFVGQIPQEFPVGCTLMTLDLSENRLDGPVPTALNNCKMLEVLNLGNNQINGTFPFCMGNSTNLRVLVLRSNKFSGAINAEGTNYTFSKLQIIDISSNGFTGILPSESFMTWKAMMVDEDEKQSKIKHETLRVQFLQFSQVYYQDTVTVTSKGQTMELVKILTVYTSIDLSKNRFQGEIPDVMGNLTSLYVLNLSQNALTGQIPSSLGNLKQLESLDLSRNKLEGEIPQQLTSLTFLAFLNLSWNKLRGMIPVGTQFQTFTNISFEGNEGLCGYPLSRSCTDNKVAPPTSISETMDPQSDEFDWKFIFTGMGFGGGAAMAVAPLIFWKKRRKWYDKHMDRFVSMIVASAGLLYTTCKDGRVETEDNMEEELSGDSDDDEEGRKDEEKRGKFCVFCSKVEISWKKIVHNPNCSCHGMSPLIYSTTSSSSSSP